MPKNTASPLGAGVPFFGEAAVRNTTAEPKKEVTTSRDPRSRLGRRGPSRSHHRGPTLTRPATRVGGQIIIDHDHDDL